MLSQMVFLVILILRNHHHLHNPILLLKFLDYFVPVPCEGVPFNSLLREFIGGSCFNV